ncbi:hypothetical protein JOU96_004512 [Salmonella enterica]|nr:hypothetical protein [Salmonella enterica]EDL7724752.1 hypothetical protein [Salmonella enterica subsp. enterica serovar Give]ECQ8661052.1 hypothetical protein [Salmonella enterica]EDA0231203.1 hypothetical protein [Salmonella enterica]EDG2099712.1 hypothetical protein [Salmonella enterica]
MDISPPYIDEFNLLTGKIFRHLYHHFPVPAVLYLDLFFNRTEIENRIASASIPCFADEPESLEELLAESPEGKLFAHTLRWLRHNNFILYSQDGSLVFTGVVLTNNALQCLRLVPSALLADEPRTTVAEEIVRNATTGALTDSLKQLTGCVLKFAVDAGWQVISGGGN